MTQKSNLGYRFQDYFLWREILTPLCVRRFTYKYGDGRYNDFVEIFIFGVRVARIQAVSE